MDCDYPVKIVIAIQVIAIILAALFLNFYFRTYRRSKKTTKQESAVNHDSHKKGAVVNGSSVVEKSQERLSNGQVINDITSTKATLSKRHVLT